MKDFFQLKKNLKKIFSGFHEIKIAVLGDTATQFLCDAIKGNGFEHKLNFLIHQADFNQIERQVFDRNSELYAYNPEIIVIFNSTHKFLSKYNHLKPQEQSLLSSGEMDLIENLYSSISQNSKAKLIYFNYTETDDAVFGSFAGKLELSFVFQLRKLNYELMQFSAKFSDFFVCDISSIQNYFGKKTFFKPSIYINTEMVLNIDVLPAVSEKIISIINAIRGNIKKCLILDLDNTLWGGIIGDDGIENIQIGNLGIGKAFVEFQYWIKKLKERGIILAVCSKNNESTAKEPFERHPDMVLKLDDIAVFVANWNNKADNIRYIQSVLNIGFDSMVFLDDNPVERSIVRENIPQVCVPELPEDPAEYLEYLYTLNLFETISVSKEDSERTILYQIENKRNILKTEFTDEDSFLKNLEMSSVVESFNKFNTPRVAQLSQRSNQFNLRTVRYTEADIENIANSKEYFTFAFTLQDRFGDNGLICVVILKHETPDILFIENWFMSCRVLKRDMENFTLNTICDFARSAGFRYLKGEYLPTSKNEFVKNHYSDLGFYYENSFWILKLENYKPKKHHIKIIWK